MKKGLLYFELQLKRAVKILPAILITVLLLCFCLGVAGAKLSEKNSSKESMFKVQVGLVGQLDEYMGIDLQSVLNLLSSKFGVQFVYLSEDKAIRALENGDIAAYALLPEGLVESLDVGKNDKKIYYIASQGERSVTAIVMDEIVDVLSDLILSSQGSIFGMQHYAVDHGFSDKLWDVTSDMEMKYMNLVLDLYESNTKGIEITGLANRVSWMGYYICVLLMIFLLMCGLSCSLLYADKNEELQMVLKKRGYHVGTRVLGDFFAYVLINQIFFWIVLLMFGVLTQQEMIILEEWSGAGLMNVIRFGLKILPACLVINAMQFFFYEIVSGTVSACLIQFVSLIIMGYVSGCFYPISFFPVSLQLIGGNLPVGVALRYANHCMAGIDITTELLEIAGYIGLFIALAIVVRRRHTESGR